MPACWLLVFLVALAMYGATASRGVQWQDSGDLIREITIGRVINPMGLALSHPVHHWLATGLSAALSPFMEPAWAITLVSALGGALAVASVFGCTTYITRSRRAGLFAAVSLGFAHTFWKMATLTEVYTLSAGLLALEIWCLAVFIRENRRDFLWLLLLLNGLEIANHMQATLTSPVLAAVVLAAMAKRRVRPADVVVGAMFWVVGALPYWVLIVQQLVATGDWAGTIRSACTGEAGRFGQNVFNLRLSPRIVAISLGFTLLSFPNLLLPAAVVGMARARRLGVEGRLLAALAAALVIHAGFVFRYNIVDQHTFFLPTYVLLAVFGGMGAAWVLRKPASGWCSGLIGLAIVLLAAAPVIYAGVPAVARHFQVLRGIDRAKPYRDDYVYLFSPWGCADRSAEIICERAIALAGADGVILVDDPMIEPALGYSALRASREGLTVRSLPPASPASEARRREALSEASKSAAAGRRIVYVPASVRQSPPAEVQWRREGDLFIAVKPASAPSG